MLARRTNLIPGSVTQALQALAQAPPQNTCLSGTIWQCMTREQREAYVRKVWPKAGTVGEHADKVGTSVASISAAAQRFKLKPRVGGYGWRRKGVPPMPEEP